MRALLRPLLLSATAAAALGAGCASTNGSDAQTPDGTGAYVVDEAVVAGVDDDDDLVASGAAVLVGAAAWDTLSVAAWTALAATSDEERRRAEEAAASGAYLGDERPVARLQPGDLPGTAQVALEAPVGTAFETEVLHRFDGGGGRLDITISGEPAAGGRRMPSRLTVSFFFSPGDRRVTVFLGDLSGEPSEVATAALPPDAGAGTRAHRISVTYAPGTVAVGLDGEPVVEAAARIGGGPMTAAVTATAPGETRAYLLRWTLDTGE
ncbi:MAG: hypothetical protein R3181_09720 [Rubricoccaceae bacterium]|nr:hypothetical protein [Rubricoccaceae bacterium]